MEYINIYQVDSFTSTPFCGNPAGVVPDANGLDEKQMQKIAREMALSETAFVFDGVENEYDYEVRFFTPTSEVDLCGHATIATFYLLAKLKIIEKTDDVLFLKQKTKAGILDIEIRFENDEPKYVLMEQAEPEELWTIKDVEVFSEIAGVEVENIGIDTLFTEAKVYSTGLPDVILPVKNLEELKKMEPNMKRLAEFSRLNSMAGLHAFTIDEGEIYVRNFAPAYEIDEESATGTANGALISYLYDHNYFKDEKKGKILVKQGDFMNRPSRIYALISENEKGIKVKVGGSAVVVLKGKMILF